MYVLKRTLFVRLLSIWTTAWFSLFTWRPSGLCLLGTIKNRNPDKHAAPSMENRGYLSNVAPPANEPVQCVYNAMSRIALVSHFIFVRRPYQSMVVNNPDLGEVTRISKDYFSPPS